MTGQERQAAAAAGLAGLLERLDPTHGPALRPLVERLVTALGSQHPCLPAPKTGPEAAALAASDLVAHGDGSFRPLVRDFGLVYLHRYWELETRLAAGLRARAAIPVPTAPPGRAALLARLFPEQLPDLAADQRRAVATALDRSLILLAGGPGTGKTTTVRRLLEALQAEAPVGHPRRVALAAPTGKAAQRLAESLASGAAGSTTAPPPAETLHRLLGLRPEAAPRFHAGAPLPYDVVIVDEASMIDLALMTRLVEALPAHARLVLLGDPDQLSSVEVGSVFGDLVAAAEAGGPLAPCLVRLRHTFRFGGDLGAACAAVREGDLDGLLAATGGAVTWRPTPPADPLVDSAAAAALGAALALADPAAALAGLAQARLLTAFRSGPTGVSGLAARAAARFPDLGRQPILITRNAPGLALYNGDVGFTEASGQAWFPAPHGGVRSVPASRLPPSESAWALTVHRSQGSEFAHVHLLLPPVDHPLLTRELVYTALSRARQTVLLDAPRAVLAAALARRVQRPSGLGLRLR